MFFLLLPTNISSTKSTKLLNELKIYQWKSKDTNSIYVCDEKTFKNLDFFYDFGAFFCENLAIFLKLNDIAYDYSWNWTSWGQAEISQWLCEEDPLVSRTPSAISQLANHRASSNQQVFTCAKTTWFVSSRAAPSLLRISFVALPSLDFPPSGRCSLLVYT